MSPCRSCTLRRPLRSSARARDVQHGGAAVDADGPVGPRRQQFEHAAGAGAEIEHGMERPGSDGVEHAPPRPAPRRRAGTRSRSQLRGLGGEIALGLRLARGPHLGEPRAVGRPAPDRRDRAGRTMSRASSASAVPMRQREKGPGALAVPLDQPGLDQQLQMARDARLRLAQDGDEFADRQFGFGQQREQAQTRFLAGGFERRKKRCERIRS